MATLKIQAPDGKTLRINVPEGTDPAQYEQIVDDVMKDYSPTAQELAPVLDTGLRAMTGSFSPLPPMILPQGAAEIPYTTGEQAGSMVAEKAVEAGVPPALATVGYTIPAAAKIALESSIGGFGGKEVAKGIVKVAPAVLKSTKRLGAELGETMAESGLKRAPEMLGEPRTRTAIIEFVDAMRGLKDKPTKVLQQTFEPQGLVQKYDEIGRVLDYLNVAKQRAPKQVVSSSVVQELSALKSKFGKAISETAPEVGKKMGELGTAMKRNQLIKSMANVANPLWWAKKAARGF